MEARAEAATWVVSLAVPERLRAGEHAPGRVRILAREGMHVNEEYPTSFRPAPEATARFAGDRLSLAEVVERVPCAAEPESACEMAFSLPFLPGEAGEVRVSGTLAFSVCNAEKCLIEKVPLEVIARAR